jgi:hypothetical protein
MPDVLSQGGDDREPSRWWRWVAVAVVVAVAAAVILTQLPHHHGAAAGPAHSAKAGQAHPIAVIPRPIPGQPSGVPGPTRPWPAGLRLIMAGPHPRWLAPASGRVTPITGLPRRAGGYLFAQAGGDGHLIQADTIGHPGTAGTPAPAGCANCVGKPLPVWFLPAHGTVVRRVGVADGGYGLEAASPGAVWLGTWPPGANTTETAEVVRKYSTTGAPLGPRVLLPAGYQMLQEIRGGLLLARTGEILRPATYLLWRPGPARTVRTFTNVLAAASNEIAWTGACSANCHIHLLNLRTGRTTTVPVPGGSAPVFSAMSPDGRFLALRVIASSGGDGGDEGVRLDVITTATSHLTPVPDSSASSDALVGFGWSGGDQLVTTMIFSTKSQVLAWHPSAASPATASKSASPAGGPRSGTAVSGPRTTRGPQCGRASGPAGPRSPRP